MQGIGIGSIAHNQTEVTWLECKGKKSLHSWCHGQHKIMLYKFYQIYLNIVTPDENFPLIDPKEYFPIY